ncbi:DUF1513 domain-containing protein [Chitinivorax sp. B]|uniref:DUF1513 domain-containing protein n=1 Tax=Chitinivorax sp. B TaxID=2502235 RepID=UPI0014855C4F|nr:DUF1513 domain-containing protein [Chitinivorax sp. B]
MMAIDQPLSACNRRTFLTAAIALLGAPMLARADTGASRLISPVTRDGRHFLAVANQLDTEPQLIPTPMRGHALLLDPRHPDQILMIARRPGTLAIRVDIGLGKVLNTWEADEDRHFFGHACLSADGRQVFIAENNIDTGQGVISVRDTASFQVQREFPSYGIGPHEILLMPDGHTLAVANGGISTLPETGRVKLNRGRFDSNLAYLDSRSGKLLARYPVPIPQLSLRHLALADDGTVAVAMQFEGDRQQAGTPLIAFHRPGEVMRMGTAPQAAWDAMRHYAASIAYDPVSRYFVLSCPIGGQLACWRVDGTFVDILPVPKVSGIAFDAKGAFASNELGQLLRLDLVRRQANMLNNQAGWLWDNHLYLG